jgi:hypothetical protein
MGQQETLATLEILVVMELEEVEVAGAIYLLFMFQVRAVLYPVAQGFLVYKDQEEEAAQGLILLDFQYVLISILQVDLVTQETLVA